MDYNNYSNFGTYSEHNIMLELIKTSELHIDIYINGINTMYYIPRHISENFVRGMEHELLYYLFSNFNLLRRHFSLKYWEIFFQKYKQQNYPELFLV